MSECPPKALELKCCFFQARKTAKELYHSLVKDDEAAGDDDDDSEDDDSEDDNYGEMMQSDSDDDDDEDESENEVERNPDSPHDSGERMIEFTVLQVMTSYY